MPTSMLGLAARMSAGKTSVSKAVATTIVAKRISFGSVVTEEAQNRSIRITRENLQDLGEALVQEDVRGFCERVLAHQNWRQGESIVVDGVRHVKVLMTLREIVEPDYFGLMYLNVNRREQLRRWKSEDLACVKSLEELEQHPTEIEVLTKLPDYADLILNGRLPVADIVRDVVRWSRSNSLVGNWNERNERRIELADKSVAGDLSGEEQVELELLQSSFTQYLATKHDPFQEAENDHERRLQELEAKFKAPDAH